LILCRGTPADFDIEWNGLTLLDPAFGGIDDISIVVPEPGSLALLGAALMGCGWRRQRSSRQA
jgi:hypothetical protein